MITIHPGLWDNLQLLIGKLREASNNSTMEELSKLAPENDKSNGNIDPTCREFEVLNILSRSAAASPGPTS